MLYQNLQESHWNPAEVNFVILHIERYISYTLEMLHLYPEGKRKKNKNKIKYDYENLNSYAYNRRTNYCMEDMIVGKLWK